MLGTILNVVALGAIGGFVIGKLPLKTALWVGGAALILANVLPSTPASSPTTTS